MMLTREDATVSTQILNEVAAIDGTDPVDLPPLFDAIDPDALESVFEPTMNGNRRIGRIEFTYAGYEISVEHDGETVVTVD